MLPWQELFLPSPEKPAPGEVPACGELTIKKSENESQEALNITE